MPNYLNKTDTDNPDVTLLENETTLIGRLTSPLKSIISNLNVRVNQLENCICPCNIARWDTPDNVNYTSATHTAIEFQNEVLEGKLCVSDSTNKWLFRAQKDGVYSINSYMHFDIDPLNPLTNQIRLEIYKNGTFWSELDLYEASSSTLVILNGTDLVNLKKGDYIKIMINPTGGSFHNIDDVYGYVDVSYQCDYLDNGTTQTQI